MTEIYILTAPRDKVHKRAIKEFIKMHDVHKWIYAKETGVGGYEHWQIRFYTSASFDELKGAFPEAHIEQSTEWSDYERKEANFVSSEDTTDVLRCRYGKLRKNQRRILRQVHLQSDRGITVVYDPKGNTGKSFLSRYLYERNIGFYVPPTVRNTQGIIQYVASGYRGQPIIVIDIPRSSRWTFELYEGIEAIKDGLVYDTRYSAKMRDIWGVKILCLTNTCPNLSSLSMDRWEILKSDGYALTQEEIASIVSEQHAKTATSEEKKKTRKKKTETST